MRVLDLGNEGSRTLPTKVGIAQPQRRAYGATGHHQVPVPSQSSQVLGENSVASKHKRFSLGIERSTNLTTRGVQQVTYMQYPVLTKSCKGARIAKQTAARANVFIRRNGFHAYRFLLLLTSFLHNRTLAAKYGDILVLVSTFKTKKYNSFPL